MSPCPSVCARGDLVDLQRVAFRAWPAARVTVHRGMRMRWSGGPSRRANSAATYDCEPGLAPAEAIAVAEAFYGEVGQPPRFQIGPTAPRGLDEALAAAGYAIETAVDALIAPVDAVLARTPPVETITVRTAPTPDQAWVALEVDGGRYAPIAATFLASLRGLGARAGFATAWLDGRPAAAGLLVSDGAVLFLAAVLTAPEQRRRGAARALLRSGAEWGLSRGARHVLLEVERENAPANALYRAAGFEPAYHQHYRVQLAPGAAERALPRRRAVA